MASGIIVTLTHTGPSGNPILLDDLKSTCPKVSLMEISRRAHEKANERNPIL